MDAYESVAAALDDIARYDAAIVRVAALDREVIERADNLKVIAKHGSGLDNVDIEAASENGIVVCNTPGVNSRSVAEHAIALQFAVRRNLAAADRHVRAGGWDRSEFVGYELQGNTLGLMGFGSIAHETATIAQGIGLDLAIYDPHSPEADLPTGAERVHELTDLFAVSDAVSLHVPLVDGTYHAVSTEQFEALGEHGILINTSRGGVVDKDALLEALDTDTIAGAGIDNFEDEPPGANHPIYEHSEVIMTPHIAGVTYDALERMSRGAAANVRAVYEGELPASTVNHDGLGREASR
ncbi:hydroxyacid dehydrogenase [Halohasta salina]|uniref:hydroxyacid dehydrogenase n=1 Tax=Halohasta salina TaxID=2961621 RepID=UPI0020A5653A|nr:hydroxyacid dehydrogenase [Halohasta salina]